MALWNFVSELKVLPDVDEVSDEDVPEGERENAELRRAAMSVVATYVVDSCIRHRGRHVRRRGAGRRGHGRGAFVYDVFPDRHRRSYNRRFFRKVLVTAMQVADDLADPNSGSAVCTAEEIIRQAVSSVAMDLCEEAGLGQPWCHPDE